MENPPPHSEIADCNGYKSIDCKEKVERSSNFELIRIFAMFCITICHCIGNGILWNIGEDVSLSSLNDLISACSYRMIIPLGQLGVSLFVLLTGYFMIEREVKVKNFLKVFIETIFYSYGIFLLCFLFLPSLINPRVCWESLFPIGTGEYWFITTYLMLYLCIPALNLIAKKISKEKYIAVLLFMFVIWQIARIFLKANYTTGPLQDFIFIYLLGGYIKLYGINIFKSKRIRLLGVMLWAIITISWIAFSVYINHPEHNYYIYMSRFYSPFLTLASVSIFYFFKDLRIENNQIINFFSSSMLAVYLIMEQICVRYTHWYYWFGQKQLLDRNLNSFIIIGYCMLLVIIVMIACVLIDKLRIKLIEKPLLKFLEEKIPIKTLRL